MAAVNTQRGATLVELLVALALLSSIAVLSAQLVIQATKLMDTAARASRNPDLVIATEWMRRDLYEAVSVSGDLRTWNDFPMAVMAQHGGWVAYGPSRGDLVRTDMPPGGLPHETRVLLNGVVAWRWRVLENSTLEIEIKSYANPHAHRNLAGRMDHRQERQSERLVFALRGRVMGGGW